MLSFLLKLLLAHILGDFLLQPNSWVQARNKKKLPSKYLYYHLAVHTIILSIVLAFDVDYTLGFLVIILSHFGIDMLKVYFNNKINEILLFFIDQLAHIAIILAVTYYYFPFKIDFHQFYAPKSLLLVTTIILLTSVYAVVIKVLLSNWSIDKGNTIENGKKINAGKYIGIAERLFIFLFILINFWEGIGFLLAAKSVFRIGNLTQTRDKNLTEYILLGTLISFGLAIGTSLLYQYISKLI